MLGYGTIHLDTRRLDPISGANASGSRGGHAVFGSLHAGHRFDSAAGSLSPYAGIDAVAVGLDAFTETGAGAGALTYDAQRFRDVSAVLGLRAQSRFPTAIGIVSPDAAIEYGRRLSTNGSQTIWYADRPASPFEIGTTRMGASPLTLQVGATLRLDGGFLFNAEYRTVIDREAVAHLLRVGLSAKI
jgi:outer membrane autotransporter protein